MAYDYGKQRAKMFKTLADHCHDKAIDTSMPTVARDWMLLMDACVWLQHQDADACCLERLFPKGEANA